ncbi:MAG: glycerophosphodiester phosphodiesterase [Clostridia bacterium]|nr:glycerophosphodiester phosphodiesterase [Clostridia bacterium]
MWEQNTEKLGVTGHRGCKAYMPENTLISFSEAFRLGVDVLEFDVQVTRDGVPVIMHDAMVDRTTDGTGAVCFMTLEEVKALDAGVKFGYPGQRVPTLDETLELIVREASPNLHLNVEIKDQLPIVVDKTMEALHRYGLVERSVIASFDAQTLLYTQEFYPEIKTQGQPPISMTRYNEKVLDKMYGMGVPVDSKRLPTDEDIMALVKFANDRGIEAWGYHADSREAAIRCLKLGFTNITANDPHDLIAYLDEVGRRVGN